MILLISCFFIFWLVQAQRTMKFREADDKAKKEFDSLGIPLTTRTIHIQDFNLHFVQVGDDTMPTLFFVHAIVKALTLWAAQFDIYDFKTNCISLLLRISSIILFGVSGS